MSARRRRILAAVERLKALAREDRHQWPELLLRMADLYRRGGMWPEARLVLDRLLRRDPLELRALLGLASVLVESGDAERALPVCRSLQRALPAMEEPYLLELRALEALGRTGELAAALEAYLGRWPQRPLARLDLAGWLEALGRPAAALSHYKKLVEEGYRPAGVYERMGALYYRAGDLPPALRCFREVERLSPGKTRVREALARIHYSQGDYEAALEASRKLVEVTPRDLAAHRLLARSALKCSRWEEASVAYEVIVEACPGSLQERREFAEALYFNGDTRDSAAEYRKVLTFDGKDAVAHYRLAEILREGWFLDEAENHYRIAHELMPDSPAPLERLGDMALTAHRHHQAVSLYLRWMMLEPANHEVHARLGKAYRQLGEVLSSRRHLARAEELSDSDAKVLYERVLLERLAGQAGTARSYVERTLAAGPDPRTRALVEHEARELEREALSAELRAKGAAGETARPAGTWKKLA